VIGLLTFRKAALAILIFLVAAAVLLPYSPAVMPMPQRDSGIFLYTGWRILQGELPYRDAWDHKPPVIYYIDALGLVSGSTWGIWLLELCSLFISSLFCFLLVRTGFGALPGLFSTGLLMLGLFPLLQGGNLTAEYALPLQWFCLWLARSADRDDFRSIRGFSIGILTGMMFFTRPNTIGVGLAIMLYLIVQRWLAGQKRRLTGELLAIAAGGMLVSLMVFGYFYAQNILGDFWEAVFRYNTFYSAVGLRQRLISLVIGLGGLASSGLLPLAFLGYSVALAWQVYRQSEIPSAGRVLVAILLIDLPLELVLAFLPGYAHPHYLISVLPALVCLAGFVLWLMLDQLTRIQAPGWTQSLYTVAALAFFGWFSMGNSLQTWLELRRWSDDSLAKYILQNTTPQESVLVWSKEGGINYQAKRRSPTRYVYLSPLYTPGFASPERITEFLDELLRDPPKMILDAPDDELPLFEFPVRTAEIDEMLARLRQEYQLSDEVGGWQVYR
jgi:Dolichyl-phosphate-mannose-protein mannosyltransferase